MISDSLTELIYVLFPPKVEKGQVDGLVLSVGAYTF